MKAIKLGHISFKDFEETVYEMPQRGYYFPNQNLMIWTKYDAENTELREYVKQIVQSVRFE